jgi:hypothetical protein
MRLNVAYANIQNGGQDSSRADVVHDATCTRKAFHDGYMTHIAGFNEIREPEDKVDVVEGMGRRYNIYGLDTPNPIFVRKWTFKDLWSEPRKFHNAFARGVQTPARWCNAVGLTGRWPWQPQKVAVLCIHFVNGAWNLQHLDERDDRQKLWILSDHALADYIDVLVAQGYIIILMGDFNRGKLSVYSLRWKWVAQDGITRIGVHTPKDWRCEVEASGTFPIRSDKPGLKCRLKITKRRTNAG